MCIFRYSSTVTNYKSVLYPLHLRIGVMYDISFVCNITEQFKTNFYGFEYPVMPIISIFSETDYNIRRKITLKFQSSNELVVCSNVPLVLEMKLESIARSVKRHAKCNRRKTHLVHNEL